MQAEPMKKILQSTIIFFFVALLIVQVVITASADFGPIAPSEYYETPLTVMINGREY